LLDDEVRLELGALYDEERLLDELLLEDLDELLDEELGRVDVDELRPLEELVEVPTLPEELVRPLPE
jgi:hypothetical protein